MVEPGIWGTERLMGLASGLNRKSVTELGTEPRHPALPSRQPSLTHLDLKLQGQALILHTAVYLRKSVALDGAKTCVSGVRIRSTVKQTSKQHQLRNTWHQQKIRTTVVLIRNHQLSRAGMVRADRHPRKNSLNMKKC